MTQQRKTLIVVMSAAQVSSGPYDLDYRFAPIQDRTICGSVGTSTNVVVLVSPTPSWQAESSTWANPVSMDAQAAINPSAHSDFWVTVSSYSGAFHDIISGPWARIKFEKTSTGTAEIFVMK